MTQPSTAPGPTSTAAPASVSAVADVLALWGLDGWLSPPLNALVPPAAPVCGAARTVRLAWATDGPGLTPLYEVLSADLRGCVLVVEASTDITGAVWGEILALAAHGAGAVAVVVSGKVRDIPAIEDLGLPVCALGTAVVGPNGRAHVVAVDEPVTVGSVEVAEGDVVVVDATGCVRIAAHEAAAVLGAALVYTEGEDAVLAALRSGDRLTSAYRHKKSAVDRVRR